jgi:oxygen-independent coproporphyrinogen-3 oxidase
MENPLEPGAPAGVIDTRERLRSHHQVEQGLYRLLGAGAHAVHPLAPLALKKKLKERPGGEAGGVYIHVPRCDRLCPFCGLNRKLLEGTGLEAYTDFLVSQINGYGRCPYVKEKKIESVYFGGGTPTVLEAPHFERVLAALRGNFNLLADCEISVETTQHNLGAAKAAALRDLGVNRFSVGIKTIPERGRRLMGRSYSEKKAKEDFAATREVFRGSLCIDILYSYPGQTLEELAEDAAFCLDYGVDSVSFYSLMIQKGSAMAAAAGEGRPAFTRSIESDRERHNYFYAALRNAGYELLELTKLALRGRDRYQYIYVQYGRKDCFPVGSGAGGRIGGFGVYSAGPKTRFVTPPDEKTEKYARLSGLLQYGSYDMRQLGAGLGKAGKEAVSEITAAFIRAGLLEQEGPGLRLTADGVFWGSNMAASLIEKAVRAEGDAAGRVSRTGP